MPTKHIKKILSGLSFEGKLVFFGSIVLLISVFMPWYEDIDTFHMGDMFLGITGPLYLVGFVLMFLSGLSLFITAYDALDKKIEKIPLEKHHLNLLVGISSLFFLLLSSSVYFHTKFGVNITMKEMGFGMIAAFIGTALIIVGGFLQNKKRKMSFDQLGGKIEPLIQIDSDRAQREIKERNSAYGRKLTEEDVTDTIKEEENKQTRL